MYRLEQTDSSLWKRAVKLSDGCTYRRSKFTGLVCYSRPHTKTLHKLFIGLKTGDMYLHMCDNPPCIDPEHVRGGTHAENMEDAKTKGRMRAVLTNTQVKAARMAVEGGFSVRVVAAYLRVSERAIEDVTFL